MFLPNLRLQNLSCQSCEVLCNNILYGLFTFWINWINFYKNNLPYIDLDDYNRLKILKLTR